MKNQRKITGLNEKYLKTSSNINDNYTRLVKKKVITKTKRKKKNSFNNIMVTWIIIQISEKYSLKNITL